MSLRMHVEFVGESRASVKLLARQARDQLGLAVTFDSLAESAGCRHPAVSLDEAHDALTDQADWNAPAWDMDAAALFKLDATVRSLYGIAPSDIVVRAIWIGDTVTEQRTVSIDELSGIIRGSGLGTHTCYYVQKSHPSA